MFSFLKQIALLLGTIASLARAAPSLEVNLLWLVPPFRTYEARVGLGLSPLRGLVAGTRYDSIRCCYPWSALSHSGFTRFCGRVDLVDV